MMALRLPVCRRIHFGRLHERCQGKWLMVDG
jgi:hypothetical protein